MIEATSQPAINTAETPGDCPKLRYPVVLVHGLLGYDQIRLGPFGRIKYFRGIAPHLGRAGNRILVPRLSPTAGIRSRALQLQRFLRKEAFQQPVHLIAHSMGGLDSRYLISKLGGADHVLSLTTIGTPHRGSSYADWWLRRVRSMARPMFDFLRIPYQAFIDLTSASCEQFNDQILDMPTVRYFSVAGRIHGPWHSVVWSHPYRVLAATAGENDGVVSIESARWGESLEIWDGDHLNLINMTNWGAVRHGLWIDRTSLYAGLLRRLALIESK
jgi:triacylglycerol lipase